MCTRITFGHLCDTLWDNESEIMEARMTVLVARLGGADTGRLSGYGQLVESSNGI